MFSRAWSSSIGAQSTVEFTGPYYPVACTLQFLHGSAVQYQSNQDLRRLWNHLPARAWGEGDGIAQIPCTVCITHYTIRYALQFALHTTVCSAKLLFEHTCTLYTELISFDQILNAMGVAGVAV